MRTGKEMFVVALLLSSSALAEPRGGRGSGEHRGTTSTRHYDEDGFCNGGRPNTWLLTADGGQLSKVDRCTGAVDGLSELEDALAVTGLAESAHLTALLDGTGRLFELDTCSGGLAELGSSGLVEPCGLVFSTSGRLYSLDAETDALYSLDVDTGEATLVGELGVDLGSCGAAWDGVEGSILVVDANSDALLRVDPNTGEVIDTVDLSLDLDGAIGAEWMPVSDFLVVGVGRAVFWINPDTGAWRFVGDNDDVQLNQLARVDSCE